MAFGQNQKPEVTRIGFCPEGVGAWLARDLPGTGSKSATTMYVTHLGSPASRAASRPIASKLRSHGLRPESKASSHADSHGLRPESKARSHADLLLPAGRRSVACPRSGGNRQQTGNHAVPDTPGSPAFRAASRPIASKLRSHGLRPESKASSHADSHGLRPESKARNHADLLLPAGRGSVACPRSAGNRQQIGNHDVRDTPGSPAFRAASRPIASKLRSHGLRPESKDRSHADPAPPQRRASAWSKASSIRGRSVWASMINTICRS
jgi:hypothetical protein